MHDRPHEFADKMARVQPQLFEYFGVVLPFGVLVLDWYDRAKGLKWMVSEGNAAARRYSLRSQLLPIDDEVVLTLYKGIELLVHDTEIVRKESTR